MKNSTKLIVEKIPFLEQDLEKILEGNFNIDDLNYSESEMTFLKLILFFENPQKEELSLSAIYKHLDEDWLLLAIHAIDIFFRKDTYLISQSKNDLLIKESTNYLNQTDFVQLLNENKINYSLAKMSVYIKRNVIPEPDLILSGSRYWLKTTCDKFIDKEKGKK